jgi:hypothetical protein
MNRNWKLWLIDTTERTARTFVQGFLGAVTLDAFTEFDATWLENLALGAMAGVYAILVAFAGKPVGSPQSASLLPEAQDPPTPVRPEAVK